MKGTIFENVLEPKMRTLIFSTTFVWNISHPKENRGRYGQIKYMGLHVTFSLFLSDFSETWSFPTVFRKIPKYQI
jgi:hypothetical protein